MRACLALLVACSAPAEPIAKPASAGPSIDVVVASGSTVRRITVTLDGARETARFETPAPIVQLEMVKDVAALRLDDHRVAIATASGIELLAMPPASTLEKPAPANEGMTPVEPRHRIFTREDELWFGRCQWGAQGAFEFCLEWIDVRLRPAPQVIETGNGALDEPQAEADIVLPTPPIAPSPTLVVELVDDLSRAKVTNNSGVEQVRKKLRCSDGRNITEWPEAGRRIDDQYGFGGWSDIVWLATEPPIFQVGNWEACYAPCPSMVTFEGCKISPRFGTADVVLGPAGVIALRHAGPRDDDRLRVTLIWRGKELATITGADYFGFATR